MSKIMPTIAIDINLFWQIINFFILIYVFNKFFRQPIAKIIEERKKKIAEDLSLAAEKAASADTKEKEAEKKLAELESQASHIISTAEKEATDIKQNLMNEARDARDKLLRETEEDIARMKDSVREDMKREIAETATKIAEKIIKKEIDPTISQAITEDFINKVGE